MSTHPYFMNVVYEIKEVDKDKCKNYCNQLLENISGRNVVPFLFFSKDEALFHLLACVNSQHWYTVNPHKAFQKPLHDLKLGAWIAVSGNVIISPMKLSIPML